MEKFRLILNKIKDCIEMQNGATESQLKAIWNDLSDAVSECERGQEPSDENAVLPIHSVMPSLHIFKERRYKLKLTLRQVAKETNVSAATISRIERSEVECSYHNIVQLDDFYCRNGA